MKGTKRSEGPFRTLGEAVRKEMLLCGVTESIALNWLEWRIELTKVT